MRLGETLKLNLESRALLLTFKTNFLSMSILERLVYTGKHIENKTMKWGV